MQSGVGLGGSEVGVSGVGEISGTLVSVRVGSGGCGVEVKKETLTVAVGLAFRPEGGMKGVGVLVGPQAANRQQNTQTKTQVAYFVLNLLDDIARALFPATAHQRADCFIR